MIAASRLKRAQDRVVGARPFAQRMLRVLNGLVTRVDPPRTACCHSRRRRRAPVLIIVTADRGLCGSFNSNIIKAAGQFIVAEGARTGAWAHPDRAEGPRVLPRGGFEVVYEQVGIFQKLAFGDAVAIADVAIEEFTSGRASSVHIVYNEFKSVMTQRVAVERLCPFRGPTSRARRPPRARRRPDRRWTSVRAGSGRDLPVAAAAPCAGADLSLPARVDAAFFAAR
jgi:F-type H+-transporting ATPase subunit gamma